MIYTTRKVKMTLKLDSNYYTDLTNDIPCEIVNEHDLKSTTMASQVIAASFSALFYLVMFFVSILGLCFQSCVKISSSQGTFFVFFTGTLITVVNVFTNDHENDLRVRLYYRLFTVPLIGIIFISFGAALFFRRGQDNEPTLGRQQPSMGLVVSLITFPLVVIEIVLLCAAVASKTTDNPTGTLTYKLWLFVIIDHLIFLLQKVIQAGIYSIYLRNALIRQGCEENAQFYFRLLSFFNLVEWLDSQANVENDVGLTGIEHELDSWFYVVTDLYKALIIDYRLLCSLLFLEHSVGVTEVQIQDNPGIGDQADEENQGPALPEGNITMTPSDELTRCIGFAVGGLCLIAPVICALQFVHGLHIDAWVNVLAIIVNIVIIVCGTCLLRCNDLDDDGNAESQGVKVMVCCIGVVGFTCWIVEAAIACFWAAAMTEGAIKDLPLSYIRWDAAKFSVRSLTTAFLIALFMKIDVRAFPLKNQNNNINYFLVPVVMLGILSMFVEGLIDQKVGTLDQYLRCEIKGQSLIMNIILFEAGPPMYLGFLIHVCLHFVIIQTRLNKGTPESPDPSYRSTRSSTISEYLNAEDG